VKPTYKQSGQPYPTSLQATPTWGCPISFFLSFFGVFYDAA